MMTALEQSKQLSSIANTSPPANMRDLKVYYDAGANGNDSDVRYRRGDGAWKGHKIYQSYPNFKFRSRSEIRDMLQGKEYAILQNGSISRLEQWKKRSEIAFTISPIGNGLDCHRTWESLILGQIVIVPTGPLNELYQDLPVVMIEDWEDVSAANLSKWFDEHQEKTRDENSRKILSFPYWYNQLHGYKYTK